MRGITTKTVNWVIPSVSFLFELYWGYPKGAFLNNELSVNRVSLFLRSCTIYREIKSSQANVQCPDRLYLKTACKINLTEYIKH